jgi:hypothetical protein
VRVLCFAIYYPLAYFIDKGKRTIGCIAVMLCVCNIWIEALGARLSMLLGYMYMKFTLYACHYEHCACVRLMCISISKVKTETKSLRKD